MYKKLAEAIKKGLENVLSEDLEHMTKYGDPAFPTDFFYERAARATMNELATMNEGKDLAVILADLLITKYMDVQYDQGKIITPFVGDCDAALKDVREVVSNYFEEENKEDDRREEVGKDD